MLNRQLEQVFNVKSIAPAGLTLDQLKPYQLAILDERTQRTVAAPPKNKAKGFRLVWKSPSKGNQGAFPDKKNLKAPIQSLVINEVDRIHKFENATDERKVFEGYLGYDGESACKTLAFECGTSYQLVLHAKGKPVRDLLGRDHTEIIPIVTGCCETCTFEENIKSALAAIQKSFYTNAFYISKFFDCHPVYSCCPVPDPFDKVDFYDYDLSICDAGDDSALGEVQIAYQTTNIYRVGRENGISTYRAECVAAQPAAFVQQGTVLSDCDTCPAGYTKTNAQKKYILKVDNASSGTTNANFLTEVQAVTGWNTATAARRLNTENGVTTYEVWVPAAFTPPTWTADADYTFITSVPAICTLTTAVTTAWTLSATKYKVKRTLEMTLKNGDCDDTAADLALLTAYFTPANFPSVVSGSLSQEIAGDCLSVYQIEQYSDCLEDGCDWFGKDGAKFVDLPGYGTGTWSPIRCEGWTFDVDGCPVAPAAPADETCLGGLKFVGKKFEADIIPCDDDFWESVETEGVELEVSLTYYGKTGCDVVPVDWLVVQRPTTPQGTGRQLWKREIQAREYSGFEYRGIKGQEARVISARMGESYSFEADKLYHTISIYHNYDRNRTAQNAGTSTREVITLACEANKTAVFAQLKTLANTIAEVHDIDDFV